jgi:succinate dehydrogenase/fumarate reductase-like Fe-S protein
VDIPNLMRTHMYAYSYGNALKAKTTLDTIDPMRGLNSCENCVSCSARCVRSVDIAGRIGELKQLYA